jgi:peptidoglycan hydrolase-like protein with peptidoglycan-binding domain
MDRLSQISTKTIVMGIAKYMRLKIILSSVVILFLLAPAPFARAALTEPQIQSILGLLRSFDIDQPTLTNAEAALRGQPTPGIGASSSCNTLSFARDLSFGMNNGEVLALQNFLHSRGYLSASPNGNFGPLTRAAVAAFQKANGFEQVGSVGPKTRARIAELSASCSSTGNANTSMNSSTASSTSSIGGGGANTPSVIQNYTPPAPTGGGGGSSSSGSSGSTGSSNTGSTPTTPSSDTTAPTVTITAPATNLTSGTTQTTLSVTTNEAASCRYSTNNATAFSAMTAFTTTGATSHTTMLSSLTNNTSYAYYVKCQDMALNISGNASVAFSVAAAPVVVQPPTPVTPISNGTISVYPGCAAPSGAPSAHTFYVDPVNGIDTNDGSSAKPWKTLTQAKFAGNIKTPKGPVMGGDTVLLRSGNFGTINITGVTNSDFVTVAPDVGASPVIAYLRVDADQKFIFKNLTFFNQVTGPLTRIDSSTFLGVSSNIIYIGNTFSSGADLSSWTQADWLNKAANGITLGGSCNAVLQNRIFNVYNGMSDSGNTLISGNVIDRFAGDGIDVTNTNVTVENNIITNNFDLADGHHHDGIQGWVPAGKPMNTNVVIKGNLVIAKTGTVNYPLVPEAGTQGISIFDGVWQNVSVSDNTIVAHIYHGLSMYGQNGLIETNNIVTGDDFNTWSTWLGIFDSKTGTTSQNITITANAASKYSGGTSQPGVTLSQNLLITSPYDAAQKITTYYNTTGQRMDYATFLVQAASDLSPYPAVSGPDSTAPSIPLNLAATAVSASQVDLTWTASTDPTVVGKTTSGVTGYRVFRGGTQVGTPTTNSYSDTGLSASTQYMYTVKAVDAVGNLSAASATANVTTQGGSNSSSWPNSSNTGYQNAPGYPGSLTPWTGGTTISSSGTASNPLVYSFYDFNGGTGGTLITGSHLRFVGDRFQSNSKQNFNVQVTGSDVTFSYVSVVPLVSLAPAPPHAAWPTAGAGLGLTGVGTGYQINGNAGYQYGVNITTGGPVTIDHADIWGFGNAVVFYSTTAQMIVSNSWIHDAADSALQSYHTDGPGYLNGATPPQNVSITGNTIASIGNTNGIAFQSAISPYKNITVSNNYLSGFGYLADIVHQTAGSSNIIFTNNIFGTDVPSVWGPIYGNATTLFSQISNAWSGNKLQVLAGTAPGSSNVLQWNPSQNGYYLWPDSTLHTSDFSSGLGSATPTTPSTPVSTTPGLVAQYNFDGNANDSSPNALTGIVGGTAQYAAGKVGQAFQFDSASYVQGPTNSAFDITGPLTLSAWVNGSSFSATHTIITKGCVQTGATGEAYEITRYQFGSNFRFRISDGVNTPSVSSPVTPTINNWYHVVARFIPGQEIAIFVNNAKTVATTSVTALTTVSRPLGIGADVSCARSYWNGLIDDARIYNKALSDSEVGQLYAGTLADHQEGVVAGAQTPTFTRTLQVGSQGADVAALQAFLIQHTYLNSEVTGYFGSLTAEALKKFQFDVNIDPVGILGPETRSLLNQLLEE